MIDQSAITAKWKPTWWQRFMAFLFCQKGHDLHIEPPLPILFDTVPRAYCAACGQVFIKEPGHE